MALIVADRVQETTNSTGTGAYTLGGAVPGFQTFASKVSNADTVYYSVTDNVNFEVGLGTYASSGGTITRTTVFSSSNSNNAVNWGIGTKHIFLTYPADKAVIADENNDVAIGNNLNMSGNLKIENPYPRIDLVDTNNNPDWAIINHNGKFIVYNETNNILNLQLTTTGAEISGVLEVDGLYTWSPGTSNLRVGKDAGKVLANGSIGNTMSGDDAGKSTTTPNYNSFYGIESGYSNTTGEKNTFIGRQAGYFVTTGSKSVILGGFNGNANGLDIRTSNNHIVLSDGDGKPRFHIDSLGAASIRRDDTTEGDFIKFYEGGALVGSVKVDNTDNLVITGKSDHEGLNFGQNAINPYKNNNYTDGTCDLGSTSTRFKDGHFSGNVKATKFIGDGSELTNVVNTGFGEVGTYTVAMYKNDPAGRSVSGGGTVAGSELDAHMDGNHAQPLVQYEYNASKINQNAGFAGTWRLMAYKVQLWGTANTNQWVGGFWLRIA